MDIVSKTNKDRALQATTTPIFNGVAQSGKYFQEATLSNGFWKKFLTLFRDPLTRQTNTLIGRLGTLDKLMSGFLLNGKTLAAGFR